MKKENRTIESVVGCKRFYKIYKDAMIKLEEAVIDRINAYDNTKVSLLRITVENMLALENYNDILDKNILDRRIKLFKLDVLLCRQCFDIDWLEGKLDL